MILGNAILEYYFCIVVMLGNVPLGNAVMLGDAVILGDVVTFELHSVMAI